MHRKGPNLLILALIVTMALPPLPGRLHASVSAEPESSSLARSAPARVVAVIGDSLSIGLGKEMERVFAARQDVGFTRLGKVSSGLAKPEFFDWEKYAAKMASDLEPDVVVVMIGANDNKNLLGEDGRTIYFTDPAWDAAYAARTALLVDACRAHKPQAKIFWVGAPVMADPGLSRDLKRINAAVAAMCAAKDGCTYIDAWNVLADGEGRFAPLAASPSGEMTALRLDDGVHITPAGSRLLALRCLEAVLPAMNLDAAPATALLAEAQALRPVAAREAAPAKAALAAATPDAAPATDLPGRHTVRPGETLWTIAKRAGTTVAAVAAVNPGLDPDRLADGVVLTLPALAAATEAETIDLDAAPATASVDKTPAREAAPESAPESAVSLAASDAAATTDHAAPIDSQPAAVTDIAQAQAAPAVTEVARQEETPTPGPAANTYAVLPGDSIWSVAKKLDVSPRELVRANSGIDPDRLSLGQRLSIPARTEAAQAASRPDAPSQAALPTDGASHVLAQGDNFWSVARRLGVRVSDLRIANPGLDPKKLQPGQSIVVPDAPAQAEIAAAPADGGYAVADGDNLWKIARRFGVRVTDLKKANAGVRPERLQPGQRLAIPEPAAPTQAQSAPTPGQVVQGQDGDTAYAVAGGDTPWAVAKRFGVSLEQLLAANSGVNPKRLQIGQLLRIPSEPAPDMAKSRDQRRDAEVRAPVAKGDNLWSLARRYGLRVDDLLAVNQGIDPMRLEIGSELVIPSREAAKAERERRDASVEVSVRQEGSVRDYTVADGDTLWDLSRRFGVSVMRIIEANAGVSPDRLEIGQPLNIPASVMAARY
ncbi:MAG: LysM peptidoglycan-binding domain-containing protein [Desulfovibrionaceae bacterium]|nr:LysM peptidoglycan-binding domain-containing protein [Desulfovibrionaceae bacterium]